MTSPTTEDIRTGGAATVPAPDHALHQGYLAEHVSKAFSGVTVLDDLSLDFRPGEVHTLMGENGAGKSTLLKILSGIYRADSGQFSMDGTDVPLGSPRAALEQGVYLVPQEPSLLPHLSVAENLYLGNSPKRGRGLRLLDWTRMWRGAEEILPLVGLSVDVRTPVGALTIAQQQLLECARALVRKSRVIFFDEPTSPLTSHEVERLFEVIDDLKRQGYVLGFISHRMDEVLEISDRISVLRDGHLVGSVEGPGADPADLVHKMVGRAIDLGRRKETSHATDRTVIEVSGLSSPPAFSDVSFTVRRGEVLGFAGLVGSGRTEIAETMVNLRGRTSGTVTIDGTHLTSLPLHRIIDAGLVYLPEDRAKNGAFLDMTVTQNVSASVVNRLRSSKFGLLDLGREQRETAEMAQRLKVRAASLDLPIRSLSGGNQQRCLFGKALLTSPKAAVFDEPTRGVDAGAKEDLYEVIDGLAQEGLAVVVISSELEELVRLCDRVLAVYEGRIVGELTGQEISMANIGRLILGSAEPEA
ncbi:sugar ABC transporter ATP-binding protein [Streptomyces sp. NPDC005808]|uniref:sugar ABC transporter ATP-binding protein n=1 Tax=Streptomyces sp. NPDC005808 TaxID=3364734 RepID=UPI00369AA039